MKEERRTPRFIPHPSSLIPPKRETVMENRGFNAIPVLIGLVVVGVMMFRGCEQGPFNRNRVVGLKPDEEVRLGAQRIAQQKMVQVGQVALAASMSQMEPRQQAALMAAMGVGSQVGILLPFSRAHESEADHIGLLLMGRAGYDPAIAPEFWQRM